MLVLLVEGHVFRSGIHMCVPCIRDSNQSVPARRVNRAPWRLGLVGRP